MKKIRKILLTALLILCASQNAGGSSYLPFSTVAESDTTEKRSVLLTGSATAGLNHETGVNAPWNYSFRFLPLILWKPTSKLFLETHFHISLEDAAAGEGGHSHGTAAEGGGVSMELEYCDLSWFINKNFTLTSGYFPAPFGIFNERIHPDWINKLPSNPLGFGHGSLVGPASEFGTQLRSNFRLKKVRMNLVVYLSNGPSLDVSTENAGVLEYNSVIDDNPSKAIGLRYAMLFPSASPFEIGFSAQFAGVAARHTIYEKVRAGLFAFDLSWTELSDAIKGDASIKMQFNYSTVDKVDYWIYDEHRLAAPPTVQHGDGENSSYRFDNNCFAGFIYQTYRPSHLKRKIWNKLEEVFRLDYIQLAPDALWTFQDRRWSIGVAYHIADRSLFKLAYQVGIHDNYVMTQWVVGL